jgi:hypothetical protein
LAPTTRTTRHFSRSQSQAKIRDQKTGADVPRDRILSLAVAALSLVITYARIAVQIVGSRPGIVRVPAIVFVLPLVYLLPLSLIWFGDALGDYTGPVPRGYITEKTPGLMVKFAGWLLLLGMSGVMIGLAWTADLRR